MRPAAKLKSDITRWWSHRLQRTRGRVGKIWNFAYFVFGLQVFSLTWFADPVTVSRYLTLLGFSLLIYVLRHDPNMAKILGIVVFIGGAHMSMTAYGPAMWIIGLAAVVGLTVALVPAWPQPQPWLRSDHGSRSSRS